MLLTIIVPCFNEPTVTVALQKVYSIELPDNVGKEVILVDDGSVDASVDEVRMRFSEFPGLKIYTHDKNLGKGYAIKTGLANCHGEIVIIQDADLEYDPTDISKVILPLLKNETLVCYGSRHLDKSKRRIYMYALRKNIGHSFIAFLGGRLITMVCNLLFFTRLSDVLTCYKAFSFSLIEHIELENDGFELEAELTAKLLKKTKIKEVSINYYPRAKNDGKKIKYIDGFKLLFAIIKYRFVN